MQGVVFDFDGVIAKTMEQHAEAYRQVLAPRGVPVADMDVYLREGARSETIIDDLLRAGGKPAETADVGRLANTKQEIFRALGGVTMYPGALDLVGAVQARTATGLVTGTRLANLELLIPQALPHFRVVMSQESYTHDKPHPEPYSKAAEGLGADPTNLVAVENAIRGVQSARRAGYGVVLGIATTLPAAALRDAGADFVARDHTELAHALEDL